MSQQGQIVIVLLLTMLVALSVGLAITQRSITDVTTSTQTEQATRAFSAAEAGIEKAISSQATQNIAKFDLGNQSTAEVVINSCFPKIAQALEYPPINKESFAQFWLKNPGACPDTTTSYTQPTFEIFFGNHDQDYSDPNNKPAVEVSVITEAGGSYSINRYYYDSNTSRSGPTGNGFVGVSNCSALGYPVSSTSSPNSLFYCKVTIPPSPCSSPSCSVYSGTPVMARVRLLYAQGSHKLALSPVGLCGGSPCRLPPQASLYSSTGFAGQSQKTVEVFRQVYVAPSIFDFALFSSGDIQK